MWFIAIADAGQQTVARPQELDLLEADFARAPGLSAAMLDDIAAGRESWLGLARSFGVSDESLECFLGWDEPDVVVQGCLNAMVAARDAGNLPLVFEPRVSELTAVSHRRVGDRMVVTIAAPSR